MGINRIKSDRVFLVTTALEETWEIDRPLLLLGEWCAPNIKNNRLSNFDVKTIPYHWSERDKFEADFEYLNSFYEILLPLLAEKLNNIHKKNFSLRYWRILVGPWLACFIQIAYDRWLSIDRAINKFSAEETKVLIGIEDMMTPDDEAHFNELMISDLWNHFIYSKIIKFTGGIKLIEVSYSSNEKKKKSLNKRYSFKYRLAKALSKIANLFSRNDDIVFINSFIPIFEEIKLQVKLRQFPQWRDVKTNIPTQALERRAWNLDYLSNINFENFVVEEIPKQIPKVYIEGYSALIQQVNNESWPSAPKLILSSGLWMNSVYMAYVAEKTEYGTPLVYAQHGGAYGVAKFHFCENHEIKICNQYISWGWPDDQFNKVIPFGSIRIQRAPKLGPFNKKKKLLIIAQGIHRYSYRLDSESAISPFNYYKNFMDFIACLRVNIRGGSLVRLSKLNVADELGTLWRDSLNGLDLNIEDGPIYGLMKNARLIVHTYNQTGILESLSYGIPTVLYCDFKVTPVRDSSWPYFEALIRSGVIHETPHSAAKHINEIWNDVDAWWNNSEVQRAVRSFLDAYCRLPKNLSGELLSQFTRVIDMAKAKNAHH